MNPPQAVRVCIVPEYPMSLMAGGLQMQAREIYCALGQMPENLSVEMFEWSKSSPLADLYHFVGFPPHLHRIAELVRQSGRRYVCTLLMGSSCQRMPVTAAALRHRLKARFSSLNGKKDPVTAARAIVTITETDAEAVHLIYGVARKRIHVVPHGIRLEFYDPSSEPWQAAFGRQPFVLSVGAVQPRKGQLSLVEACNRLKLPVVLLGPVLPGEATYAQRVAEAVKKNEPQGGRWVQHFQNDDPLLISAFGACQLFVLFSTAETQPISVLQALAARKPVLLLDAPYTRHPPFDTLATVESLRAEDVSRAVKESWNSGKPSELSRDYGWNKVARRLREIYLSALISEE